MIRFLIFLFVSASLLCCKPSEEDIQIVDINNKWKKENAQSFNFEIKETSNPKNIIFVFRNNNDYPYSNIRLIVDIMEQETKKLISKDTLNYIVAKPNGEWLGKGFGETKELELQYKTDYQFPKVGKYSFKVVHAMRNDILLGIEDIGIKIENTKP